MTDKPLALNSPENIDQIIEFNLKTSHTREKKPMRGQHPRHHGGVYADFTIRPDIPKKYRQGLFKKQNKFSAFIRFSNGAKWDDRKKDAHGIAIRLFDKQPSPKNITTFDEGLIDFLLVDHPVFFIDNDRENFAFNYAFTHLLVLQRHWRKWRSLPSNTLGAIKAIHMLLGPHRQLKKRAQQFASQSMLSPFRSHYWSTTPYKLGESEIVKYQIRSSDPLSGQVDDVNGLRKALEDHLVFKGVKFIFGVIPQSEPITQPIDKLSANWVNSGSTFVPIADLTIEGHSLTTLKRNFEIAENLAFNPWNTPEEHEPLGLVNRTRKIVYDKMAMKRSEQTI